MLRTPARSTPGPPPAFCAVPVDNPGITVAPARIDGLRRRPGRAAHASSVPTATKRSPAIRHAFPRSRTPDRR